MATRKPKKALSQVTFEHDGAHVALVAKTQGGPANGHAYSLILKSNNFSPEAILKMQEIQVTMDVPTFLEKFFHMYGSDAEVLARMMGYVPPKVDDQYDWQKEHEEYIQERMSAFTIIKSLHEAEDTLVAMAGLSEDDYIAVLKSQEMFETLQKNSAVKAEEGSTEAVAKAKESDDKTKAKVEPSGVQIIEMENTMEIEVLQKSFDEQKELLEKATAELAVLKAAQAEAITKSKTAAVEAVVKSEKHVAAVVKAALSIENDEDFTAFVAVLKEMNDALEKSELFEEKGASAHEEVTKSESPVAKAIKASLAKSN